MIYFKNTLTGKKEEFMPIKPDRVGMYNCGPTVYGKVHIGNMRAYVFADLVKQVLLYNGYGVDQVINITDVGHLVADSDDGADKVEEQAKKERLDARQVTDKYTEYYMSALEILHIDTDSTRFPRASEHIAEQIEMIRVLEEKGFAYVTSDGVYFDTTRFEKYGALGNIDIAGLQEGARVEKNSEKRALSDFSLWKFSKETRLQEWDSPWGVGFPGWHIECSAMAKKYLGETFDIHTGGVDHIPVHHNNEIAQSEGAHSAPLARFWLHVNHITVEGGRIEKSRPESVVLLEDLHAQGISPRVYKYWLYTSHYSTLSNFSIESVRAAQKALGKILDFVSNEKNVNGRVDTTYRSRFLDYINDDLNTPKAIALMFDMMKDTTVAPADIRATLLDFDRVLRLDMTESLAHTLSTSEVPHEVQELASARQIAREAKDFDQADALRLQIENLGFTVRDTGESFVIEIK